LNLDSIKLQLQGQVLEPVRVESREFTMMENKATTDHLIGECHISFDKLLSGIISISSVEDNDNVVFGES
jgi:hypothetical protein